MTTTFETSKRLKDAGFPQPEPQYRHTRQVWYDTQGIDWFFGGSAEYFAPTATDILSELPGSFRLGASVFEKDGERHVEFVAWNVVENDVEMISAYHPNAAEALARVWLDLEAAKKRAEQVNPSGA